MRLCSRFWLCVGWVGLVAGLCSSEVRAQGAPTPPSLTVDRDPVPSPDADEPVPGAATGAPATAPGDVGKANGHYTLSTDVYEVRLDASVIDGSGRTIQTLPESAFHVYEDGVPQTIASFRHEDLPVSIGLLIDNSGSMYDKLSAVKQAAVDLVKLSNPKDEEFLVDFNDQAFIDQDFTSSLPKLEQGLGFIEPKGQTAIRDTLVLSADYLTKNAKNSKQVLIVITDGDDNASTEYSLEQTIRRIQDLNGPVIYCIGLLFGPEADKHESKRAQKVLETLSQQTGGQAYFPRSLKEVDGIAATVAADIRSQYTIAYHSTNPPSKGGYREVHVTAKDKGFGKLEVRTRSGYYPRAPGASTSAGTQ